MKELTEFLRKEALETRRTWRIWVLPGILLFMGLTSPLLALITPQLIKSIAAHQPGMMIQLPEPTCFDSYAQMLKNLTQIVLWAVIIAGGGILSSERRSGTAVLVLTKPLSRTAFVIAKTLSSAALLVLAACLASALCWLETLALFGTAPLAPFAAAIGTWLILALLINGALVMFSALLDSPAGASGLGLAFYLTLSLAAIWRPLSTHTPAGLFQAPELLTGQSVPIAWPVVTALVLTIAFVIVAIRVFNRREL